MEQLHKQFGNRLQNSEPVKSSLALLAEHAKKLSNQMSNMDMGVLCTACATRTGGCCSSYMEANSDVIVLLINRLYGIDVQRQHNRSQDCCFLGKCGCILDIKPMFCLNYNCSHIHQQATRQEMALLEHHAGTILTEQIHLEEIILQSIKES